jgi:uncharacterized protein (TIGR02271 family)
MAENERPGATRTAEEQGREPSSLVRHEEELRLGREVAETGPVRVRKEVETGNVEEIVPLQVEHFEGVEQRRPNEQDSGEVETLPDGSISIPVLEEELVVTKRTVVRERLVIHKRTATEQRRVEADLRKERVEIDADARVDLPGEGE